MHLHGDAGAVLEMLAGGVEVELLEVEHLVGAVGEDEGAVLADDFDGRPQVLKGGALGKVGEVNRELNARDLGEAVGDYVDGRLVGALSTRAIRGAVEGEPIRRALYECVNEVVCTWGEDVDVQERRNIQMWQWEPRPRPWGPAWCHRRMMPQPRTPWQPRGRFEEGQTLR